MPEVGLTHFLIVSSLRFCLGSYGIVTRKNAVMAQKPHGSSVPERIRLPYTAQTRFLYQGTLGFHQPIKVH